MTTFIVYLLVWFAVSSFSSCALVEDERDQDMIELTKMVEEDVDRQSINYGAKITERVNKQPKNVN
jgi:hypothetical protein